MKSTIIIPARFESSRFPGKPLALIYGQSLIFRTWSIAKAVQNVDNVYIATDDIKIQQHAEGFGAKVIMTSSQCKNGTERVFEAASKLNPLPEIIINFQGDALLTPPWVLQSLTDAITRDSSIEFATLATKISIDLYRLMQKLHNDGKIGGTMVVCDKHSNALYFSKNMIPLVKENFSIAFPLFRHIGLYAYKYDMLSQYVNLDPTPLEMIEGLEQLRALEHGIKIKVVQADYQGRTDWAIDSPGDIEIVEKIISKEGEIIAPSIKS